MNDFVNSFNEIIDKVSNYSKVDGIFVQLFKKANYFDFSIDDLKEVENLMRLCCEKLPETTKCIRHIRIKENNIPFIPICLIG